MRRALLCAFVACAAFFACFPAFARDIAITRADGSRVTIRAELATTPDQRARGLMMRTSLKRGRGMLFIYERPAQQSFWMKDTLIPLDMLFFTEQGELAYIHANAEPKSLTGRGPARSDICAVLELGGGEAAHFGLRPGDRLELWDASACLP